MSQIDTLLKELQSTEWWVRNSAMKRILEYPEESYLPFLEEGLRNHEDATLRNASMEFFVALGARGLPSLMRLSRDGDTDVRIFVANVLGDIRDCRAMSTLFEGLHDEDVNVRMASAEAIGKIGDESGVEGLRQALDDEPWVAMAAIKALGDIGGEQALETLYESAHREEYQGMVFEAVERAGNCGSMPFLISFLGSDDLRDGALKAVVNIAERRGCTVQPEVFGGIMPLLLDLQHSLQPELRRASLIALSWVRDSRSLPFLIDALNDDELQEFAVNGIIELGKEAVSAIVTALRQTASPQRSVLAKLLVMLGEESLLIPFACDDDPDVRVEVALALSSIQTAEADEILSRMLADPEEEVRLAAGRAIEVFQERGR